jgi:hypothetical protein
MCLIVSIFSEGHVVLFICCLNFEKKHSDFGFRTECQCEAFDAHVSHACLLT